MRATMLRTSLLDVINRAMESEETDLVAELVGYRKGALFWQAPNDLRTLWGLSRSSLRHSKDSTNDYFPPKDRL